MLRFISPFPPPKPSPSSILLSPTDAAIEKTSAFKKKHVFPPLTSSLSHFDRRYKARFNWDHYVHALPQGAREALPVETQACASVTSAFLQVRFPSHLHSPPPKGCTRGGEGLPIANNRVFSSVFFSRPFSETVGACLTITRSPSAVGFPRSDLRGVRTLSSRTFRLGTRRTPTQHRTARSARPSRDHTLSPHHAPPYVEFLRWGSFCCRSDLTSRCYGVLKRLLHRFTSRTLAEEQKRERQRDRDAHTHTHTRT